MDEKIINKIFLQREAIGKKIQRLEKALAENHRAYKQFTEALSLLKTYDSRIGDRLAVESVPHTVGEMAVSILREHPEGLEANQILEKIKKKWMPSLVRTSLSPPLSRLKAQGVVSYKSGIWYLNSSSSQKT